MNNTTEIVFLIDASGSMHGLEGDTIGGFNATVAKQREEGGNALVTTVLFADEAKTVRDRISLADVPLMTKEDYRVGGCTALLDAVGEGIAKFELIHKYARKEDVPARTIFVITTDGMENASRRYDAATVKRMVERKREEGWEFVFLAANIDAALTAERMGIGRERAANYRQDKEGVGACYAAMSAAISAFRSEEGIDGSAWKDGLDKE